MKGYGLRVKGLGLRVKGLGLAHNPDTQSDTDASYGDMAGLDAGCLEGSGAKLVSRVSSSLNPKP